MPPVIRLPDDTAGEEWFIRVGPAYAVDTVRYPTCLVRHTLDGPPCGQRAAYRAAFHVRDAPPALRDAASHVCVEHGQWARQRPGLVQLRTVDVPASP